MSTVESPVIQELVASVEPFIIRYSGLYAWRFEMDAADLAQVARVQAWRCAQTYDDAYGVPFINYCARALRQAMRREAMQFCGPLRRPIATFFTDRVIRVPLDLQGDTHASRNVSRLSRNNGRDYSARVRGKIGEDPVLDMFRWNDVTPREQVDSHLVREAFTAAIGRLKPRLREVIMARFIEGQTLEEIGTVMNVTRERVRQIESVALDKLRRDPAVVLLSDTMLPRIAADYKATRLPHQVIKRQQPRS